MKDFLGTFALVVVLTYLFLFFGGFFLFDSIWRILFLVSLFISILITAFVGQERQIKELEKRIQELESQGDGRGRD